jgi:S1-C subfamily serine protease
MSTNTIKLFSKFGIILLSAICFLIAIKSSDLLEKQDIHKENFVTISLTKYLNVTCEEEEFDTSISIEEDTSSEENQCIPGKFPILESTASGLIIRKIEDYSYILTANHFCNSNPVQRYPVVEDSIFENIITISDHKSENYEADIVFYDKLSDLCLLKSKIKRNVGTIRFSDMPEIGEKIYTIASPLGISESGILLHFEGFFSGCENIESICFYTIPATSGSSGSVVFDMHGSAIGIIQMTPVYFRSMSIGVGSKQILIFLNNASKEIGVDII